MLHSTLPRAFLPPGLSYLGGYYGEDAHLYTAAAAAGYVPCIEDPYSRIPEPRVHLVGWEPSARPPSPSPLDLSLKPPADHEALEVDDEDDRRCRVLTQRRYLPTKRSFTYSNREDPSVEDAEDRRSPSVHSYHSYDDSSPRKEPTVDHHRSSVPIGLQREDILASPPIHRYHSYEEVPTKRETPEVTQVARVSVKGHPHQETSSPSCLTDPEGYHPSLSSQKDVLLAAPNPNRVHGYHQQLLLTPQHHLQGIHAPMTPPSTPSPPQCPRRRAREVDDVTTPNSATGVNGTTLKSQEKGGSRPKKKHARRLKFDEDTSSPVSGTVILGPDEAVVTGDIDPAFNIVEVTEEARAELAKIENRLGPYQCKLCRQLHEDAFQLAQHRCSRIAHVEYRCPECDKRFSCPANLASHRRWHKPRIPSVGGEAAAAATATATNAAATRDPEVACARCDAKFTRPAALRKHLATQHPEGNNDNQAVGGGGETTTTTTTTTTTLGIHEGNAASVGKTQCAQGAMHLVGASIGSEAP